LRVAPERWMLNTIMFHFAEKVPSTGDGVCAVSEGHVGMSSDAKAMETAYPCHLARYKHFFVW
jgi:hypothetical protein